MKRKMKEYDELKEDLKKAEKELNENQKKQ